VDGGAHAAAAAAAAPHNKVALRGMLKAGGMAPAVQARAAAAAAAPAHPPPHHQQQRRQQALEDVHSCVVLPRGAAVPASAASHTEAELRAQLEAVHRQREADARLLADMARRLAALEAQQPSGKQPPEHPGEATQQQQQQQQQPEQQRQQQPQKQQPRPRRQGSPPPKLQRQHEGPGGGGGGGDGACGGSHNVVIMPVQGNHAWADEAMAGAFRQAAQAAAVASQEEGRRRGALQLLPMAPTPSAVEDRKRKQPTQAAVHQQVGQQQQLKYYLP
jgi:hypothetical protein